MQDGFIMKKDDFICRSTKRKITVRYTYYMM